MFERIKAGKELTLFSPADVPELKKLFFSDDYEGFKAEYERCEARDDLIVEKVSALELMQIFIRERSQTGRYYFQDAYHTNAHTPFNPKYAPVRQSNLCLEIALPTEPLVRNVDDEDAEIALCTLSALNWLVINTEEEMEEICDIVIEALDMVLSYQDYPLAAAERSVRKYRPLGVGVINYAADIARHSWKYGDREALNYTHRKMEMMQYYLMKASVRLAKEKGRCDGYENLNIANNKLVIDSYCKNVDELHDEVLHMDWDSLRKDIDKYGIRNATVTALMPSETSSQVVGATNGIEPPRSYVTAKKSKSGALSLVVPNPEKHLHDYTYAWDMPNNKGYLHTVAVFQKFVDQTISANFYYDPKKYPNDLVPTKVIMADMALCQKYGIKTGYYHNTRPAGEDKMTIIDDATEDCGGGGCKI
ncbi:Ribonucleoside-diphosphate reductase 1 subunit alpha [Vibrio phage vB_VpaM_sm033]|nr:Ribonucleoside-diphosphate reductase 1 subunit alpha [Vibrio phage vB_VpaM_sm033]